MIKRIYGLETEYGCLAQDDMSFSAPENISVKVKDHIFYKNNLGVMDIHHRGWDEPPGNGGFLFNSGRVYIDMGHIEYATPECTGLFDTVTSDKAGERILQRALADLGLKGQASFIKNNVDHFTGATFGCHENYLLRRDIPFSKVVIPKLLPFFVTRQIFTGAGRVGNHNEMFDYGIEDGKGIEYQISQRADYIVTEIYQWIQFSRSIVNSRDEPLADYTKYRRLHLLVGDSNMSEYAIALKIGTTAVMLSLVEGGHITEDISLMDPVQALKDISRDQHFIWLVRLGAGRTISAVDIQRIYLSLAQKYLKGRDEELDWVIREWESVLDSLERDPMELIDRVDWVAKRSLLETFVEEEGVSWDDPWIVSLDLEYHNIDPENGLYYGLERGGGMRRVTTDEQIEKAIYNPPQNTRARGRAQAARKLSEKKLRRRYAIDWDSIYLEGDKYLDMKDPFKTYQNEVSKLFKLSKVPFFLKDEDRSRLKQESKRSRRAR